MTLNPNIPLQAQGVDTATPLRQLGQDLRQNKMMQMQEAEQAQMQELRDLQIIGQRYQNLDNREKSRLNSVTMMAAELSPLLEKGDVEGALSKLKARRQNLGKQIAEGLPVDTSETDRLISMIESGDLETAQASLQGQVQFGQMLGILESPEGSATANMRDFMLAQENPEYAQFLNGQNARQLSGTEAIAEQLIREGSARNYGEALEILKGGAGATGRLGAEIQMGRQAEFEKKTGQNQSDLQYKPQITEANERARVEGAGEITEIEQRDQQREAGQRRAGQALRSLSGKFDNIDTTIDKALDQAGTFTTGFIGQIGSFIPGTPQADLAANLETIQADAAFSALQEMRDASKTGGALGQVSERELGFLRAARASLLQSQSPDQFKDNLRRYRQVRKQALENAKKAYEEDYGQKPAGETQRLRFNPETGDFE